MSPMGMSARSARRTFTPSAIGKPMRTRTALGLVLITASCLAGCGKAPPSARATPPPPQVTVTVPAKRTVVDLDEYVGRFVAVESVEIRSRVSGYLHNVQFTDGQ